MLLPSCPLHPPSRRIGHLRPTSIGRCNWSFSFFVLFFIFYFALAVLLYVSDATLTVKGTDNNSPSSPSNHTNELTDSAFHSIPFSVPSDPTHILLTNPIGPAYRYRYRLYSASRKQPLQRTFSASKSKLLGETTIMRRSMLPDALVQKTRQDDRY
ncbi:hypothetical protein LY76DRAFT_400149 [Colletotrichum caudatum]|nr:hypothetical protein LY76DRAFT_400149 [Colletotrichum caudatum]